MLKVNISKVKDLTGMSNIQIAKRIGVTNQLLTKLKKEEAPMQLCYMYKMSKLAGVSINELIIEDES